MDPRRKLGSESVRLFLGTARAEILGSVALAVVLAGLAVYGILLTSGGAGPVDADAIEREVARPLLVVMMPGIAALGSLVGAWVAAPDIERGTAQLGWALAGRRRWLALRAVPSVAWVVILMIPVTILTTLFAGMRHPDGAIADDYGTIGVLPVLRVVAAWAIGLLAGVALGRSLAALLVGFGAALAGLVLSFVVWPYGVSPQPFTDDIPTGSRVVETRYRDTDGRLLSLEEAEALAPPGIDGSGMAGWVADNLVTVSMAITPDRLGEVELQEVALLAAGTGALVLATLVVVDRRRPT